VKPLQYLWTSIVQLNDALDDSWTGDLIGVVSIFGSLWIFLIATWGM